MVPFCRCPPPPPTDGFLKNALQSELKRIESIYETREIENIPAKELNVQLLN